MGPGGLKRRKNREARAHADNDGRHEATRQDEITARHQTPYTLTAPPTRHHTTPLLRSIPGVHNKAQPQMSSGPARAAARQGPFRSGALDVVTAAGTGPDPLSVISYQLPSEQRTTQPRPGLSPAASEFVPGTPTAVVERAACAAADEVESGSARRAHAAARAAKAAAAERARAATVKALSKERVKRGAAMLIANADPPPAHTRRAVPLHGTSRSSG